MRTSSLLETRRKLGRRRGRSPGSHALNAAIAPNCAETKNYLRPRGRDCLSLMGGRDRIQRRLGPL